MYPFRINHISSVQFSSVAQLCPTLCDPMDCSMPASLSIINSQSLFKFMSAELVMPSNHLILCHSLLSLPSIFSSIRVFSNESVLHIRWPKYWSFSFNISPSNEYIGLISFRIDWFDLHAVQVKWFLMKVIRSLIRERRVSSTNGAGKIGYPHGREWSFTLYLHHV